MIKKFYDTAATEAGATETIETNEPVYNSVAEALAKAGVKSSENVQELKPVQIKTDKKEETKTTETEAPAATATEEVKVDEVETKNPPATEVVETKVEEAKKEEQPLVQQKTWQELVKTEQPDTVLQALGFDGKTTRLVNELKDFKEDDIPQAVGLLRAIKEGKGTEYLQQLSTDYSKMSGEEVMLHQLRKDNPHASERQIALAYKRDITERYNLDSEDEVEKEEGMELLNLDSEKFRQKFIEEQKKFKLPEVSDEPEGKQVDEKALAQQQLVESVTKKFNEDSYTKSVLANNKITIGEGEEKFEFPVDGKDLVQFAITGDENLDLMFTKEGDEYIPKTQHQLLVAAVAKYGEKFFTEYAKHLKSLGSKKAIEPIENAKRPDESTTSISEAKPDSPAAAMGKFGVLKSGG